MEKENRIKIIYIIGYSRCGSTFLESVLNEISGFFSAGEVYYLWSRGIVGNWYCACGQRFHNCKHWSRVSKKIDTLSKGSIGEMLELTKPIKLWKFKILVGLIDSKLTKPLSVLKTVYENIAKISRSHVIIDSSKWPTYGRLLGYVPALDIYYIHLVRNPRSTAISWSKIVKYEPNKKSNIIMPKHSVIRTSVEWLLWNTKIEIIKLTQQKRFILLRYEDFVENPGRSINNILKFIHENKDNPLSEKRSIFLHESHAVSGNPSRFVRGDVVIRNGNMTDFKLANNLLAEISGIETFFRSQED